MASSADDRSDNAMVEAAVATATRTSENCRSDEEDELVALAALLGLGNASSALSDDSDAGVPAALRSEEAAREPHTALRRRYLAELVAAVAEDIVEDSEGALPLVLDATGLPDHIRRAGAPQSPKRSVLTEDEAREIAASLLGALDEETNAAAIEILRAATKKEHRTITASACEVAHDSSPFQSAVPCATAGADSK